jgi:hypothetical protein
MAATDARSDRHRLYSLLLVAGGTLLLVLSFLIPVEMISRTTWDANKARDFQQKALRVHELTHEVGGMEGSGDAAAAQRELAEATKEYDEAKAELSSATQRPRNFKAILRWTGIATAAMGLLALLVVGNS